ncbi:hypothetical protein [Aureibacillus halotolerans]|nr:hypothetical protein [Aureibacillus halotolerans]
MIPRSDYGDILRYEYFYVLPGSLLVIVMLIVLPFRKKFRTKTLVIILWFTTIVFFGSSALWYFTNLPTYTYAQSQKIVEAQLASEHPEATIDRHPPPTMNYSLFPKDAGLLDTTHGSYILLFKVENSPSAYRFHPFKGSYERLPDFPF